METSLILKAEYHACGKSQMCKAYYHFKCGPHGFPALTVLNLGLKHNPNVGPMGPMVFSHQTVTQILGSSTIQRWGPWFSRHGRYSTLGSGTIQICAPWAPWLSRVDGTQPWAQTPSKCGAHVSRIDGTHPWAQALPPPPAVCSLSRPPQRRPDLVAGLTTHPEAEVRGLSAHDPCATFHWVSRRRRSGRLTG